MTLPTGAVISNTVDGATGDLLAVRANGTLITSFAYDAAGNVVAEGDRFGTNGFAFDAHGNALRMTNTLGHVIESGYDANGNLTNLVDGGALSSFTYDALNREAFSDYGNGITLSNHFESHLDWTSVDAPTIGHMERKFDDQGRLAGWKTVNGATPGFAYNANGQLEYETNSIGQVTRHTYDPAGRQTAVQNLTTGAGSGNGFDAAGRRIAETNALGGFSLYAYNPDGSVAAMTNAFLTNVWLYAYETGGGCCGGSGATTSVTDPFGRVVTSVSSSLGLPLQTIATFGTNSTTNSTFYLSGLVSPEQEAEDYPIAILDEGGRRRDFGYTGIGQLHWATDLGGTNFGGLWTNVYAADGALLAVISPTGETNSFVYDDLDNIKTNKFSDGYQLVNFYDAKNRLISNSLPSGASVHLKYDDAGRLTNRNSSLGETATFRYNGNDAVTTMVDNTGSTTNLFDSAGQLSGIDYPTGASVRYYRDLLGRITNVTAKASGAGTAYTTKYWYDAVGNLTQVVDPLNGTTQFEYDRVNRRTKRVLPNGVTTEWQYDWQDRVTNITHKTSGGATLARAGYVRSAGGEPTRITREDDTYVDLKYDAALRLTNEVFYSSGAVPQSTNGYGFDKAGNRVRFVSGGTTFTNTVQKGFRVTEVKNGSSTEESYGYDNGGRMTNVTRASVTLKLAYNSADQLVAVTNGTAWTNYVYDASGRRVRAEDSGGQRRFLVAPTPDSDLESIHLVADSGNNLKQGYVYVGDEPLLRFNTNGNPVYYLEDAMGSVIGLVSNGTAIATFKYDGFGQVKGLTGNGTNAPAGTGGDFRFHGAWLETTTDLYHMRAREYDQRTGRFLSRDRDAGSPENPESLNPYLFSESNPLIFSDPSGEFTVVEVSISANGQTAQQTFKSIAAGRAKAYAKEKAYDFVSDTLYKTLDGLMPVNLTELLSGSFRDGHDRFEDRVVDRLCEAFRADDLDWLWLAPSVTRRGEVRHNGWNCGNRSARVRSGQGRGRSTRPDFIISEAPPLEPRSGLPKYHNKALLIGDFKVGGSLNSYATGAQKPQFDAIINYASKYTYIRAGIIVSVFPGKAATQRAVARKLMNAAVNNGTVLIVISLDPKSYRRR